MLANCSHWRHAIGRMQPGDERVSPAAVRGGSETGFTTVLLEISSGASQANRSWSHRANRSWFRYCEGGASRVRVTTAVSRVVSCGPALPSQFKLSVAASSLNPCDVFRRLAMATFGSHRLPPVTSPRRPPSGPHRMQTGRPPRASDARRRTAQYGDMRFIVAVLLRVSGEEAQRGRHVVSVFVITTTASRLARSCVSGRCRAGSSGARWSPSRHALEREAPVSNPFLRAIPPALASMRFQSRVRERW